MILLIQVETQPVKIHSDEKERTNLIRDIDHIKPAKSDLFDACMFYGVA
jgi:hypothetical protein